MESIVVRVGDSAGVIHAVHPPGELWRFQYECIQDMPSTMKNTVISCERGFNSAGELVDFVLSRIRNGLYPVGMDGFSGWDLKRVEFPR